MGAILLLAALGALALMSSSQSKPAGGDVGSPENVQAELKKLYAANGTAANAVNQMLVAQADPALIAQYALQLAKDYPGLSKTLLDRFKAAVRPFTGASGTVWNTWANPAAGAPNIILTEVLLDAMPVLSFQQTGTDLSTRKIIATVPGVDSATVARAKSDFSV